MDRKSEGSDNRDLCFTGYITGQDKKESPGKGKVIV